MNNAVKLDQPVRNNWTDWRMMRDVKRRKLLVQHQPDRIRIRALKKNDILPSEIVVTFSFYIPVVCPYGSIQSLPSIPFSFVLMFIS